MGVRELVDILSPSIKEFREEADADELVLKSLRRNGQLAYCVHNKEFVEITAENSPWLTKLGLGHLGSHRYPRSWLEDRFSWLVEGAPPVPDWSDFLSPAEKLQRKNAVDALEDKGKLQDVDAVSGSVAIVAQDEELKYQDFLLQKLGKYDLATSDEQFTVDHTVIVCGKVVKVPVLTLEIDEQENLIHQGFLEILRMTPEERRARAFQGNGLQKLRLARKKKDKILSKGSRLKLALRPFSKDLVEQLEKELHKKTRSEVFKKITFAAKSQSRSTMKKKKGLLKIKMKKFTAKKKTSPKEDFSKAKDGEEVGWGQHGPQEVYFFHRKPCS
jgi:hypothetical protein